MGYQLCHIKHGWHNKTNPSKCDPQKIKCGLEWCTLRKSYEK